MGSDGLRHFLAEMVAGVKHWDWRSGGWEDKKGYLRTDGKAYLESSIVWTWMFCERSDFGSY